MTSPEMEGDPLRPAQQHGRPLPQHRSCRPTHESTDEMATTTSEIGEVFWVDMSIEPR